MPFSFQSEGGTLQMLFLVLQAYIKLIRFDLFVSRGIFAAIYQNVRDCAVRNDTPVNGDVERICSAVDLACIWYWKEVLCLQRSAATACLLKRHGVPAQMVIGAQQIPFKAHAWVEVNGNVVNDKPYTPEMYAVLDRC
jgi:Transglutaminase-like superfamily